MELLEKLKILSDAAKYDVSCSSSGSNRKNKDGIGNASLSGICHSWSEDGRCISLLKILFTNHCIYNCSYCINAKSLDSNVLSLKQIQTQAKFNEALKENKDAKIFLTPGGAVPNIWVDTKDKAKQSAISE